MDGTPPETDPLFKYCLVISICFRIEKQVNQSPVTRIRNFLLRHFVLKRREIRRIAARFRLLLKVNCI